MKSDSDSHSPDAEEPLFLVRLRSAPEALRAELLLEYLRARVAAALGVEACELEPRTPLMAFGMSSLRAIELKTLLERELDHPLESSLLFDHPTLESLTPFLLGRLGLDRPAPDRPGLDRSGVSEVTQSSGRSAFEPLDIAAELAAELAALRSGGE